MKFPTRPILRKPGWQQTFVQVMECHNFLIKEFDLSLFAFSCQLEVVQGSRLDFLFYLPKLKMLTLS